MNEQPQSNPNNVQTPVKKRNAWRSFSVLLLCLLVICAASLGVYVWQQKNVQNLQSENDSLKQKNLALAGNLSKENQSVDSSNKSLDDVVTEAFNNYCNRNVLPQGYERDNFIGKISREQKRVVYSDDQMFAAINGRCGSQKIGATSSEEGSAAQYIFKKVNDVWLVTTIGQEMPSDAEAAQYGFPEGFLALLR